MLPFCSWFLLMSLFETVICENLYWNTFPSTYHIDCFFNIFFQLLHDAWFEYLQISGRTKHTWKLSGFAGIWIFSLCKFGILFLHVCAEEILHNKIFSSSSKLIDQDISVSLSLRVLWKLSWDVHICTQI